MALFKNEMFIPNELVRKNASEFAWVFSYSKHMSHFIKHKPIISEE